MRPAARLVVALAAMLAVCSPAFAQKTPHRKSPAKKTAKTTAQPTAAEKQLEKLCRGLKDKNPRPAYTQLAAFAQQKSSGVLGLRASLALGYFDYGKGNYAQAAKWFARAKGDSLLADYAVYWIAETNLASGHSQDALVQLKEFRAEFPDSPMTDQALQSLGEAALAANRPADAVATLNDYSLTPQRPFLLLLRGEARELAGDLPGAVSDYQTLYTRFAPSEQGKEAARKLTFIRSTMGSQYPELPIDQRFSHAAILFAAKDWSDARDEYSTLMPQLTGADHELAQLRILECGMFLGAGPSAVGALQINDPSVDAERFNALAQTYRSQQRETEMIAAVEAAFSRAPTSDATESALYLAGNYYWAQLDRDHALTYYKRLEENFPKSSDAIAAQWRVAWIAVLKRQPEAAELLENHLRRFPGSPYTSDALYWLGRLAEEAGAPQLARSYYSKLTERYPQNYFQCQALARLKALGAGPVEVSEVVSSIPPVSAVPKLDGPIPVAAAAKQARADALRSIGFDSSAELELRAAYAATNEPRLLLEAAQAAVAAGHYGAAIVTIRQIFPQLESQPFSEVPRDVWLVAYALPYENSIRRWSIHEGLDPMLVAALIHQESAFEADARSNKNATGLMQLLPTTAHLLAKKQRIRYAKHLLTDPDYNVRLGTAYFAGLQKQFGTVEAALAAYNAGEDRVISWTAGPPYRENAEFVDSIPFTETRQYVEIITRNAEIYRHLYGASNESRTSRTSGGE
jgi:soluble lytic murein transglycosylase